MIIFTILAVVSASTALQANPQSSANGEEQQNGRIIGGSVVTPHSLPYQAFITAYGAKKTSCGGSILTKKVILTAAHCIYGYYGANYASVLVGAHNRLLPEISQQTLYGKILVTYLAFNPITLDHDVGLIVLNSTIKFNAYVQLVNLPALGDQTTFAGRKAIVGGWGSTSCSSSALVSLLRSLTVRVLSAGSCSGCTALSCPVICTVAASSIDSMPYWGDDGGPLVDVKSKLQIGIFSTSTCLTTDPARYARITYYRTWIDPYLYL